MLPCTLCRQPAPAFFADYLRTYHDCPDCGLIFADPRRHLSQEAERSVYDLHENDPDDAGYRRFLSRLASPLLQRLIPGMRGLDYGCGPGPALARMLQDAGMAMSAYDPFYVPDVSALRGQYDFLTCTEVVEHFRQPGEEWGRMLGLVRPGGWVGVMTQPVIDRERFSRWQYKNDPTHVSFYREQTIAWIAREFGFVWEHPVRGVFLMRKV